MKNSASQTEDMTGRKAVSIVAGNCSHYEKGFWITAAAFCWRCPLSANVCCERRANIAP